MPAIPFYTSSSWSSDDTGGDDSGSSIDNLVDDRHSFTHNEESRIRRSLRRKLLSNNGARLSDIERRLLHADHRRTGAVSISTFKAALAAASRSDNGADIPRDEALWLIRCLMGRNGKSIAIMKMREILENKESVRRHHRHRDRCDTTRKSSSVSQGREERRRRKGESTTDDDGQGWTIRGGGTTSESDSSSRGGAALQWKLSPPSPARWATRQGTVGQWLHEVAAPMVSVGFSFLVRVIFLHQQVTGRKPPSTMSYLLQGKISRCTKSLRRSGATIYLAIRLLPTRGWGTAAPALEMTTLLATFSCLLFGY